MLFQHALTIDRDAEVTNDSPVTDVFQLMVQMYPSLPVTTNFLTGRCKLNKKIAGQPIYDMLGPKCASAMSDFRVLWDLTRVVDLPVDPKSGASRCSCLVMMRFWKHWHH